MSGLRKFGPFVDSGRRGKRKSCEAIRGRAQTLEDAPGPAGRFYLLCKGNYEERVIRLREIGLEWLETYLEAAFSAELLGRIHRALKKHVRDEAALYSVDIGRVDGRVHIHILCLPGACSLGHRSRKPISAKKFMEQVRYFRKGLPFTEATVDAYRNVVMADGRKGLGTRHRSMNLGSEPVTLRQVEEALGVPLLSPKNQRKAVEVQVEAETVTEPQNEPESLEKPFVWTWARVRSDGTREMTLYTWGSEPNSGERTPIVLDTWIQDLEADFRKMEASDDPTERLLAAEYRAVVAIRQRAVEEAQQQIQALGNDRIKPWELGRDDAVADVRQSRDPLPPQHGPPLHVNGAMAPPFPA